MPATGAQSLEPPEVRIRALGWESESGIGPRYSSVGGRGLYHMPPRVCLQCEFFSWQFSILLEPSAIHAEFCLKMSVAESPFRMPLGHGIGYYFSFIFYLHTLEGTEMVAV